MNNGYAKALNVVGWLVMVAGIIGSFILGSNFGAVVCIAGILSSVIFALVLLGLGEIIYQLDASRGLLRQLLDKPVTVEIKDAVGKKKDEATNSKDELPEL